MAYSTTLCPSSCRKVFAEGCRLFHLELGFQGKGLALYSRPSPLFLDYRHSSLKWNSTNVCYGDLYRGILSPLRGLVVSHFTPTA